MYEYLFFMIFDRAVATNSVGELGCFGVYKATKSHICAGNYVKNTCKNFKKTH